jgi:uncharacterized protein
VSTGTILELRRFPAKGFAGEDLRAARLGPNGMAGDRVHTLSRRGKPVSGTALPRLMAWRARYPDHPDDALDPADPPPAEIIGPDGHVRAWGDPGLAAALSADLGHEVALHREPAGRPDVPDTVLITVEASRRAVEASLEMPIDIRRFRPNLHVILDAPAYAEADWTGRRIRAGGAILEGVEPCDRCVVITRDPDTQAKWGALLRWVNEERGTFFGLRARIVTPGRVATGDPVEVSDHWPA